jgi:hypothetical protein
MIQTSHIPKLFSAKKELNFAKSFFRFFILERIFGKAINYKENTLIPLLKSVFKKAIKSIFKHKRKKRKKRRERNIKNLLKVGLHE